MVLITEKYSEQVKAWPAEGRHILAQYDEDTVIVYQAYHPDIARFAVEHGMFGGKFRYSRMSWVKPNFLWMMYRSGWGTKENYNGRENLDTEKAQNKLDSTYHEKTTFPRFQSQSRPRNTQGGKAAQPDCFRP